VRKVASRKDDDNVRDITVEILKNIRDDMRGMREELGGLRVEMREEIGGLRVEMREEIGGLRAEMREEIGGLRAEMRVLNDRVTTLEATTARGFVAVTARLENLRDFSGELWRDHERRIRRLEGHRG
jgi:hypothetical protein